MPKKNFDKLINEQIRAERVRVIGRDGKQLGVFPLKEAIEMARAQNLDLILITAKADPPVCKIEDYGKFLYEMEKTAKGKEVKEAKGIRLGFNISQNDLEIKANQAARFLRTGHQVMVDMILRGREKLFQDIAIDKMKKFLEILDEMVPIKIDGEIKKVPRGLSVIINKK